jgi:hypothetical protein
MRDMTNLTQSQTRCQLELTTPQQLWIARIANVNA